MKYSVPRVPTHSLLQALGSILLVIATVRTYSTYVKSESQNVKRQYSKVCALVLQKLYVCKYVALK